MIAAISVHADLIAQGVNADLMDVGVAVDPVQVDVLVLELVDVSATEIVLERNAEMTVVTLEIFVISVVPIKFVEVTSDVPEPAHPTAEILMEQPEFVVTMDASDLAVNVFQFQDKISDAEMDNVPAVLNVMLTPVVLMDVEELVELVLATLNASTEPVSILVKDAAETVFAKHLWARLSAVATLTVMAAVSTQDVRPISEKLRLIVSKIV